jgi:uncharacterized protein YdeI (BOF family)
MAKKRLGLVFVAMALCELVAGSPPWAIARASIQSNVVSTIAEARALPLGTEVTIEGSVTVPSGAFKSSLSDEGFALQDGSAGIYVSTGKSHGLSIRRRVRVTGKLSDSNGLLTIVPNDARSVRAQGRGQAALPEMTATGTVSETTEGRLVKVKGTITRPVVSDLPYGSRLFINDGTGEIQVYISASTRINLRRLQPGRRVEATGFSGQYKDHYEVNPRLPSDIKLIP